MRRRRHPFLRTALIALGWLLLVIGFLGGLIPFFQGWPFGVLGAALLYLESRTVQRQVRRWRQRHPRFERAWIRARAWLKERRRKRKGGA